MLSCMRKGDSRVLLGIVTPKVTHEEAADLDRFISTGIRRRHADAASTEIRMPLLTSNAPAWIECVFTKT